MKRLERTLLQLTIVLIPANLAYHFQTSQANIFGRSIDYLIPRIYSSDLPLLLLLILWLAQASTWHSAKRYFSHHLFTAGLVLCFTLSLIISSAVSPVPLPSFWYLLKLSELGLFFIWLICHCRPRELLETAYWPLVAAFTFELFLSIYQFIAQKSLVGYYLLGEPTLRQSIGMALGTFTNSLKILPYGTTPHPNVLAGFAVVVCLWLLTSTVYNTNVVRGRYHLLFIIMSTLILIGLTRSWESLFALAGGLLLLFLVSKSNSSHINKLLFQIIFAGIIISVVLLPFVGYHYTNLNDNGSISRRYKLDLIAGQLIRSSPLFGTGPNAFIPAMLKHNYFSTAPFIQPVHNLYLLWLAETGLVATGLGLLLAVNLFKSRQIGLSKLTLAPLMALLIIGFLDHYPLTLQTGQLLLVLSTAVAVTVSPNHR